MSNSILRILFCATLGLIAPIAAAQLPSAGDVDPSGRVLARLSVTITEPNVFGHPISGLRFLVVADNGDRIAIRTDDAGTASAWLVPGSYRFVTPDAATWENNTYTWDVIVPIRPGTGLIKLSQSNASKIVPIGVSSGAPVPKMEAVGPSAEPIPAVRRLPLRDGFWFNFGAGYGLLGCKDCNDTVGGFSGGLSLGGTLSPRFLLGVGTTGWTKSENGTTLTVGTLDARLRFYPSATGGFFLTGGLGVGTISGEISEVGSASESGVGIVLGLGVDIRVGDNFSLTPFWNGFAIQTSNADANVGQIGVGLTFH